MTEYVVYACTLGKCDETKHEICRFKREWQASNEVKHQRRKANPGDYVWFEAVEVES